jgi:hypothetical protein
VIERGQDTRRAQNTGAAIGAVSQTILSQPNAIVLVELGALQRGKIAFAWDEVMLVSLHPRCGSPWRAVSNKTTDIVALKENLARRLTTKQICGGKIQNLR